MFKVGQKVRVKDASVLSHKYKAGDTATYEDGCIFRMYDGNSQMGKGQYGEFTFEPVEEREFKVGDRFKVVRTCANGNGGYLGKEGYLIGINSNTTDHPNDARLDNGQEICTRFDEIELIPPVKEVKKEKAEEREIVSQLFDYMWDKEPKYYKFDPIDWLGGINIKWASPKPKKRMATLSALASKLFDADTKALIKAGYLDSELDLTEEGEAMLLDLVLLEHKEELAKEARKAIKKAKKEEEE